eukprot:4426570-Pyramimonas_sp.AAC.1
MNPRCGFCSVGQRRGKFSSRTGCASAARAGDGLDARRRLPSGSLASGERLRAGRERNPQRVRHGREQREGP